MNLGKSLATIATAPVRVGSLPPTPASALRRRRSAWRIEPWVRRARRAGRIAVVHMLGIDDTITRANRLARLVDDDAPLGRALATGRADRSAAAPRWPDRRLTAQDGVLDRLTAEGGGLDRALAPGGLVEQLLAEDGLVERVLAEDGLADRLLAEGGLIDKLTARNGPLEQLGRRRRHPQPAGPGMEALAPTIETLREAVIVADLVVNPLSNIAERIPLPGRRRHGAGRRGLCVPARHRLDRSGSKPRTTDPIRFGRPRLRPSGKPAGLASLAQW